MANLQTGVVIDTATGVAMNSNEDEDMNLPFKSYRKKNQRRAASCAPATLLLCVSGATIFWGVFKIPPPMVNNNEQYSYYHSVISWFVGAIIGAILVAFLVRKYKRSYFMYASGALMLLTSIIFIALPGQYEAILISRYLLGIAHGLVFVTALIHAGEIAPKRLRGEYLSSINLGITGGLLATTFYYRSELEGSSPIHSNTIYGGISVALSLMALVFVAFFFRESPIFLADTVNENAAHSILLILQKQTVETPGVRSQFIDTQRMIAEESNASGVIYADGNWTPLLQAGLLRGLLALGMSLPLNMMMYLPYIITIKTSVAVSIPLIIRFFGETFAFYALDRIGRRKLLLISMCGSGLLLLVLGILIAATNTAKIMVVLAVINAFYQFFLGFGLSPISTLYTAEAFPLSKKALSVSAVVIVECLLHVFVLLASMVENQNFQSNALIFTTAVLLLLATGYFFKSFPETRNLTLRECNHVAKQSSL